MPACDGELGSSCVPLGSQAASSDWGRTRTVDCSRDVEGNKECGLITIAEMVDSSGDTPVFEDKTVGHFCHAGDCDEGPDTCDGDVLVSCVSTWRQEDYSWGEEIEEQRFKQRRFDCSKYGLVCDTGGSSGATCRHPNSAAGCVSDFCDGRKLIACSQGIPTYEVDCRSFHSDFECVDRGGDGGANCAVPTPKRVCESGSECINETEAGVCIGGVWVTGTCSSFQSGVCSAHGGSVYCLGPGMSGVPSEHVTLEDVVVSDGSQWTPEDATSDDECSSSEWRCIGGGCIPDWYVCDGDEDCEFGEDEYDCGGAAVPDAIWTDDIVPATDG